jgi:hypothetical protein
MRTEQLVIDIDCELDDEYFGEWDLLTPEIQAFWEDPSHKCNCEGSGVMSSLCADCPFCSEYEVEHMSAY